MAESVQVKEMVRVLDRVAARVGTGFIEHETPERIAEALLAEMEGTAVQGGDLIDLCPDHVLEVREDSWALEHPLPCRLDQMRLLDCDIHVHCTLHLEGPPAPVGRYRVELADDEGDAFGLSLEWIEEQS